MKDRILIIEDDEIMRVTIEDSLNENGYLSHAYERGFDGVSAFKDEEFSLVVTDVRLPDIMGIEVLQLIKEINEHVPVIVMTAFGTIKDVLFSQVLNLDRPFYYQIELIQ